MIRDDFEDEISEEAFRFDTSSSLNFPKMENFANLTEESVKKIIMKTKSKTCELDPLPTTLLKMCID